MRRLAFLLPVLLAACARDPFPYAIIPGGTLPAERYAAFERVAAATPVQTIRQGASREFRFEPRWVYSVDPGLQLATTTLQVGPFTDQGGGMAGEVAAALPAGLVKELSEAHLFASVTTSAVRGAIIISGTVTRADTQSNGFGVARVTQVEARLTRDGKIIGAIQVNMAQPGIGAAAVLLSAVLTALDASRVDNVASKFHQVFDAIATGQQEGLDPDPALRGLVAIQVSRSWTQ